MNNADTEDVELRIKQSSSFYGINVLFGEADNKHINKKINSIISCDECKRE